MLIQMLDQHCAEQQKGLEQVHEEKNLVKSEYDFVYLPIDFRFLLILSLLKFAVTKLH